MKTFVIPSKFTSETEDEECRTIRTLDDSDLSQFGPNSDLSYGQFGPWTIRTLVNSDIEHWLIKTRSELAKVQMKIWSELAKGKGRERSELAKRKGREKSELANGKGPN